LVCSLSDSGLSGVVCCRCNSEKMALVASSKRPQGGARGYAQDEVRVEQGTPRSPEVKRVDAAVQTASPPGSWWNLERNVSYASHSVLGSPPGSRLNLRSSAGSNSNLVSPSSSMFFEESGEEEEEEEEDGEKKKREDSSPSPVWETSTRNTDVPPMGRRRSCLKAQGDERLRLRDEAGRRSSMKQVQWDEEGMTWDVYGSTVDAEELNLAIQRHLKLRVGKDRQSPRPPKKKATQKAKVTEVVHKGRATKTKAPEVKEVATAVVEGEGEGGVTADPESKLGKGGSEKQELAEDALCGKRGIDTKREESLHPIEDAPEHKWSSSCSPRVSLRRGVMWSLKKPWCGGSSKDHN